MKIYTRTGDEGETGLFGGGRVSKTHLRVEAYGTVDELNAHLGRVVAVVADAGVKARLETIQHDLFALGSILASPPSEGGDRNPHVPPMPRHRITDMEGWMDAAAEELPPLRAFIVPGGTQGGAELHVARTVCRRAERRVIEMAHSEADAADPETEHLVRYLNRLSDLLFVLARLENHREGSGDVQWRKEAAGPDAGAPGGDGG